MKVARGVDAITHLQFVDDNFLMGEASIKEAENIKIVLENHRKVIGKMVNWHKSEIFFFNTTCKVKTKICQRLGMKQGVLPNKYLGIPLFEGRSSANLWKDLIDS